MAIEDDMDLVLIAPNANPPVCRIMDYSKFKYQQSKNQKEVKKKQNTASVKEIRLSINIEKHDMETKAKQALKFLNKGDTVKITIRLKGREIKMTKNGFENIETFLKLLGDEFKLEKRAKLEGRSIVAFIEPIS